MIIVYNRGWCYFAKMNFSIFYPLQIMYKVYLNTKVQKLELFSHCNPHVHMA